MSDRRPPTLWKTVDGVSLDTLADEASSADLVAAVRRGVESGTIKGEVEWWECFEWDHNPHHICDHGPPCGFYLVIGPVSDGGSET